MERVAEPDDHDQLTGLARRVAALEERLEELEAGGATPNSTSGVDRSGAIRTGDWQDGSVDDVFWALQELKRREPEPGAVMMVGAVQTPAGGGAQWQLGATTEDLLSDEWDSVAPVLDALGHPIRLRLLKEVLQGRATAKELAAVEDMGSTGQVYHHLRILTAAGWLRARPGGEHEIPAERIVPLLTCVLGGRR